MHCSVNDLCNSYANALYNLSEDASDATTTHAMELMQYFESNPETISALNSRHISGEKKLEIIALISSGHSELIRKFLSIIVLNGRIAIIQKILKKFLRIYADIRGEVDVLIRSSSPVASDALSEISSALSLKYGNNLIIENMVDKSIFGGIIILVNHVRYDFSLRTALDSIAAESKVSFGVLREADN